MLLLAQSGLTAPAVAGRGLSEGLGRAGGGRLTGVQGNTVAFDV
jgi:hypothetical protein